MAEHRSEDSHIQVSVCIYTVKLTILEKVLGSLPSSADRKPPNSGTVITENANPYRSVRCKSKRQYSLSSNTAYFIN